MISRIQDLKHWQKTLLALIYDYFCALMAFYLALALRLDDWFFSMMVEFNVPLLIITIATTQLVTFYFVGVYRGVWRYSSTKDLIRLIKASTIGVFTSLTASFIFLRLEGVPRSSFFIDWLMLIVFLGGGRLLYRIFRDQQYAKTFDPNAREKAIIIGAGAGGEQLHREILKNPSLGLHLIGYLDDSKRLQKKSIHNVPVLGQVSLAQEIIPEMGVTKVFIAIPSASSQQMREILNHLDNLDVSIKTLPKMSDILNSTNSFSNLRDLNIEDLLGREVVNLKIEPIMEMLTKKVVLITGAGGSIGTELSIQLASFEPSKLYCLDLCELNCYKLDQKLRKQYPNLDFEVIVSDVRDLKTLEHLFSEANPDVVLHAAAYKHVPMMEFNPYQAINTNVIGTKNVAETCIRNNVDKLVLVSTDKAVNPTNIMGASKRIAEMVLQNLGQESKTKLITVRFGNVLGSSGSVIPLFKEQLREGKNLTVTHPDVTRFFMSIPEASKLVLQAGALGNGGEIFVLDMGEPVKIQDLAKEMIRIAKLDGESTSKIDFIGLRPGEKLYEEPLLEVEPPLETSHPKVKVCKARPNCEYFEEFLERLLSLDSSGQREAFIQIINQIVPEYRPYQTSIGSLTDSSLLN